MGIGKKKRFVDHRCTVFTLTLKAPITTAADDTFKYIFLVIFLRK